MAHPQVTVQVGLKWIMVCAERQPPPQAEQVLLDYYRHHPALLRSLAGMLGYSLDGGEADVRFFASQLPMVALYPVRDV
jgi:hypothetical protein